MTDGDQGRIQSKRVTQSFILKTFQVNTVEVKQVIGGDAKVRKKRDKHWSRKINMNRTNALMFMRVNVTKDTHQRQVVDHHHSNIKCVCVCVCVL